MPKTRAQIYRYHVCNLQAVKKAVGDVGRLARNAVARQNSQKNLRTFLRLHALLIGMWAETRLKKILYEDRGFSEGERASIENLPQIERWKSTIDLAFRRNHKIAADVALDEDSLGVRETAVHKAMHELLENRLRLIIEIRNSLAHGQWIYPLTQDGTDVQSDHYREIEQEDALSLMLKHAMLRRLTDVVHDLVVNPDSFDRGFEAHYKTLRRAETHLKNRRYVDFEKELIDRWERGRRGRGS